MTLSCVSERTIGAKKNQYRHIGYAFSHPLPRLRYQERISLPSVPQHFSPALAPTLSFLSESHHSAGRCVFCLLWNKSLGWTLCRIPLSFSPRLSIGSYVQVPLHSWHGSTTRKMAHGKNHGSRFASPRLFYPGASPPASAAFSRLQPIFTPRQNACRRAHAGTRDSCIGELSLAHSLYQAADENRDA